MAINGRIGVDVVFHDFDGTASLKIVSLQSSDEYTTGKVAVLTATAGTASVALGTLGATTYRDASGQLVTFSSVRRVAFAWSGSSERVLTDLTDNFFVLRSDSRRVSVSDVPTFSVSPEISVGTGTGTYTIVLYGT